MELEWWEWGTGFNKKTFFSVEKGRLQPKIFQYCFYMLFICLDQMFQQIRFRHSCIECLHIRLFHSINLNVKFAVSETEHLKKHLIKNVALI